MKIELIKASGRCMCRGETCPRNPEYIDTKERYRYSGHKEYYIRKGTTCASIVMSSAAGYNTSYYCRDCIQIIHDQVRAILNPQLWIFM